MSWTCPKMIDKKGVEIQLTKSINIGYEKRRSYKVKK